jgi:uncharacterized protein (DUF427 family)
MTSQYWAAAVDGGSLEEVAWCYRSPALECAKVTNLVCFFNERVDLSVDGVKMTRPNSPWS